TTQTIVPIPHNSPISKVHTLFLRGTRITDTSTAEVLSACEQPLQRLIVHRSGFAHESIQMLLLGKVLNDHYPMTQEIGAAAVSTESTSAFTVPSTLAPLLKTTTKGIQHSETLRELDLGGCHYVKSQMVQQILESCPQLEILVAPTLKVRDIMIGSQGHHDQDDDIEEKIQTLSIQKIDNRQKNEWVCKNLKQLEVQIEIESSRADLERPFILAWLASMKKLTKIGPSACHSPSH
ncbi:hypothetical protein FBU30_010411, partial [Linnemannia zychae]